MTQHHAKSLPISPLLIAFLAGSGYAVDVLRMRMIERLRKRAVLERLGLTVGLVTFFVAGYFGVGLSMDPAHAHELATPLDMQSRSWRARSGYLWMFPAALVPLFVIRCPRLLRRTALAYAAVIAFSLVCFTAFPVTSARLRVAPAMLDVARKSDWAVSVLYSLDPPYNLFPSLHVSIAALAASPRGRRPGRMA